jgi:divalent metal cation (Fe/Co/Zn/Cd) transporter
MRLPTWSTFLIAMVVSLGVIVGVYFAVFYILTSYSNDWTVRGQIGDSFNLATSFFSALGFFVLFFTLRMQFTELTRQRDNAKLETARILIDHYQKVQIDMQNLRARSTGSQQANATDKVTESELKIGKLHAIMDNAFRNLEGEANVR